jgi:hypothetical protein
LVALVLHRNVTPPVAINVTESPGHNGATAQTIAHTGAGFTVTVAVQVPLHPLASVTVTVYVVVALGFTVIDAVVAPVLQRNDVPPEAVSVDEPPTQMEGLEGVMLQDIGTTLKITTAVAELVHPLAGFVTVTVYVPAAFTVGFCCVDENELGPVQLKVTPAVSELAESWAVESEHVIVSPVAVTPGGTVSWITVTSAKQLSDKLNGFVTVNR